VDRPAHDPHQFRRKTDAHFGHGAGERGRRASEQLQIEFPHTQSAILQCYVVSTGSAPACRVRRRGPRCSLPAPASIWST
jgi:hypothetical protein